MFIKTRTTDSDSFCVDHNSKSNQMKKKILLISLFAFSDSKFLQKEVGDDLLLSAQKMK
jgi:hypothetical protein